MHHIYAHRGVSGLAIENTAKAVRLCAQKGIFAIEIDLQLLGDNSAVLFHDVDLKRLANRDEKLIDLTKAQFEQVVLNMPDKTSEQVLFMDEFLDIVLNDQLKVNVELKRFDKSIESYIKFIVKPLIEKLPLEQLIISSFDFELLQAVREFSKKVDIAVLSRKLETDLFEKLKQVSAKACHLQNQFLEIKNIQEIKQNVELLGVFTVNEKSRFQELKNAGVDYVFSDYPHSLED